MIGRHSTNFRPPFGSLKIGRIGLFRLVINKGSNLAFHVSSVYVISFMVQPWFLPMLPWTFMSITHIMAPYHDIYRHAQTFISVAFSTIIYVIMHGHLCL